MTLNGHSNRPLFCAMAVAFLNDGGSLSFLLLSGLFPSQRPQFCSYLLSYPFVRKHDKGPYMALKSVFHKEPSYEKLNQIADQRRVTEGTQRAIYSMALLRTKG